MKNLLLLSTSKVYGTGFLEYAAKEIKEFFQRNSVEKVLFVPYAQKDHDKYLETVQNGFAKHVGIEVEGIHKKDPKLAVLEAKGIFIGGGNTFLLLKSLIELGLTDLIRNRVLSGELAYMGSSAGTNVATLSISTTNDMPIVHPPTFQALNLVSFNINPHYLDPDPNSKHMGETRETRIAEYHQILNTPPVVGLREGSILEVQNGQIILHGPHTAKVFIPNKDPQECDGTKLNLLLKKYF